MMEIVIGSNSINYLVDKIQEIEVLDHKRYVAKTSISKNFDGPKSLVFRLDESLDQKVDVNKFYRKWNFKLFEVLKKIFDNGETSPYEKNPNSELTFNNSICERIYYDVYSLNIIIDVEEWNRHYLKIERDKKLRELGL